MMGQGRSGGQRWSNWGSVKGTLLWAVKIGDLGIGVDGWRAFWGVSVLRDLWSSDGGGLCGP